MLTTSLQCKLGDFGVSRLFDESTRASLSEKNGAEKFAEVDPNIIPSGISHSWNPVKSKQRTPVSSSLDDTEYGMDQTSNVGTAR